MIPNDLAFANRIKGGFAPLVCPRDIAHGFKFWPPKPKVNPQGEFSGRSDSVPGMLDLIEGFREIEPDGESMKEWGSVFSCLKGGYNSLFCLFLYVIRNLWGYSESVAEPDSSEVWNPGGSYDPASFGVIGVSQKRINRLVTEP
ncbi:MAG: hypothetical protein R3F07_15915 [Opitutaceae bacterium]